MLHRADTCAVVVTYKNPELLKRCTDSIECSIIVEDNSEDNRLYTVAVNFGIRRALMRGRDYILICCDDVIVRPGTVTLLRKCLQENPKAAIAAPVQEAADGSITFAGGAPCFPHGIHYIQRLSDKPYKTLWANGACFLLRAEAVRECGLLDEKMRFICSDSDYSLTLRARGWDIMVVPDATVQHEPNRACTPPEELKPVLDQDYQYFVAKWVTGGLFAGLAEDARISPLIDRQYADLRTWLASIK